jgi:hypothetical protein
VTSAKITATRPSTASKTIEDQGGLLNWKPAAGLQWTVHDPELLGRAQVLDPHGSWRPYAEIIAEAERRYSHSAGIGSNIHAAVSKIIGGEDMGHLGSDVLRPAEAVLKTIADIDMVPVASEIPVACIGVFAEDFAGTADLILRDRVTGKVYVGDIKTVSDLGAAKFRALSWAAQVAVYARSEPYDLRGLPDYHRDRYGRPVVTTSFVGHWDEPLSTSLGVVIEVSRDTADAEPHALDLDAGAEAIRLACQVRAMRRANFLVDSL